MLKSPWLSSFSSTPHKIHSTILLVLIQNTTSIFNYFLLFSLILLWFKILLTLSLRLLWQPPKWFFCFHLPLKSSRVGPQNCDQTGYSLKKKGEGERNENKSLFFSRLQWLPSHLKDNHIQCQRNPIKTPFPPDTQRSQTNLVHTRTQGPHRDWDKTMFEHLLWRCGSAVDFHRNRGSGCNRLGHSISPLGGGHH